MDDVLTNQEKKIVIRLINRKNNCLLKPYFVFAFCTSLAVLNIAGLTVSHRLKATDLPSERGSQWKLHILCRSSPAELTLILIHTVCLFNGLSLTLLFISF